MSTARIYVDGTNWEIMGNVTDKFLPYSNTINAARSGRNYATTETKTRSVAVDEVKVDPTEFGAVSDFLTTCGSKRFTVTVAFDEGCDTEREYQYLNCQIMGDPEHSIFEKKISGFEFAYEERIG